VDVVRAEVSGGVRLPAASIIMSDSCLLEPAGRKLKSLDGLRAMAIILVFLHHMDDHIPGLSAVSSYLRGYVGQGWVGVDLFFALSGFLITGILIDSREAKNYFSGFYARRALRIFPLYYLVLIGLIVASVILTKVGAESASEVASMVPLPEDRWTFFFFLTNWIGLWKAHWDANFGSILAHFWSLGVEEQFYFFWPLIVWMARPRAIPWIAGSLAALSVVIRFAWAAHIGVQMLVMPVSVEIGFATICRLDGLFIGALCAYFFREAAIMERIRKWLPWVATAGVGAYFLAYSAMLFFSDRVDLLIYGASPAIDHSMDDEIRLFLEFGGYTALALGFGALVLFAACTEADNGWFQRFLKSKVLAPIGRYSYGIYVFHVPILGLANLYLLQTMVNGTGVQLILREYGYIAFIALLSFGIAALSYEFFEKKILNFKRKFEPRYAPASGARTLAESTIEVQMES